VELSRLIANFTEAHPQVITLRSQIAALERQLEGPTSEVLPPPAGSPALSSPTVGESQSRIQRALRPSPIVGRFVAAHVPARRGDRGDAADSELLTAMNAAAGDLARASRQRMAAEHRLNDRMQELSSQPTAAHWSAGSAEVITRLGGTPRSSTLALGALLASVAGVIMFRAAGPAFRPKKIETTAELASALEIPILGNTSQLRTAAFQLRGRLLTPARVRAILFGAEGVVVVAVAACLVAIAVEPALARQVLADPFGTLSEVLGRFGY
jgi:hypothetical protein